MNKLIRAIILSVMSALASTLILLIAAAWVIGNMEHLPTMMPLAVTLIGCISAFLGGLLCSLLQKERGILNGIWVALVYSLIVLGVSIALFQQEWGMTSLTKLAAFFISSVIGGILGVNRKSKVKF